MLDEMNRGLARPTLGRAGETQAAATKFFAGAVAMGLVFPPVGLIAFIVSATAGVDLMKVYKGTSILMISMVITTVLLMIFPQIALWLPATMR